MSAMTNFSFEGTLIRTLEISGELWFVAADVCGVLDVGNITMALKRLDTDEQALISIEGFSRGNNQVNVINESGLYILTLTSRKPNAKKFKRWVTGEVLPTIRKTGGYGQLAAPVLPQSLSAALRLAADQADQIEVQQAQLAIAAPAIAHLQAVQSSKDDYSFQEMANILQEHGFRFGRNRLMNILRRAGVLTKASNMPMQDYRERGYFRVVQSIRESPSGRKHVDLTTYVTGKGHNWLTKTMDMLLLKAEKLDASK